MAQRRRVVSGTVWHGDPEAAGCLSAVGPGSPGEPGLTRMPELDRKPGGKPYFPHEEGLEFNLSHSGHLALCALDNAPVGADIQMVREWRPGLPARVCGPEELAWLEGQPDWWRSFSLLWSLKESRVKESGQGLRGTIRSIRVPMMGEGETRQMDGLWFRTYGERAG